MSCFKAQENVRWNTVAAVVRPCVLWKGETTSSNFHLYLLAVFQVLAIQKVNTNKLLWILYRQDWRDHYSRQRSILHGSLHTDQCYNGTMEAHSHPLVNIPSTSLCRVQTIYWNQFAFRLWKCKVKFCACGFQKRSGGFSPEAGEAWRKEGLICEASVN